MRKVTIVTQIVMKNISNTGYNGSTALEPMNWDYMNFTPEEFLKKAFEVVKKLESLRYEHL